MTTQIRTALLLMTGMTACLLLTAFVYWNGLTGGFMLDDGTNIIHPYIENPGWRAVLYVMTHNGSGMLGRSVSILSFVLTGLQYGLDAWGYKYHNLLLHLLNGVLLFHLLLLLLPLLDRQLEKNRILLVAGVTAVLWLLHPLQVSTVLYAVQRMTQLAVLFTLLALLAYVKARIAATRWQFYCYGWFLFPLFTVLAALSKETGALIPVYVLVIELMAFPSSMRELRTNRRLAWFLGVFMLAPLVLGAGFLLFKFDAVANYNGRNFTLGERLLTQVHVLFFYIRLILLPRIRDMSLFHDDYPVVTGFDFATAGFLVLLLALLAATWALRRSLPVVAFGLAFFLASHLLESTVIPLEMVFEHRNYLALAGLLLLPVYAVFKTTQFRLVRWLCPVVALGFALMTTTRAAEWGDSELFHTMSVTEHPASGRALNNYINFLVTRGEYDKVRESLEKQVLLTPEEAGARLHLQIIKCGSGERDEEALMQAYDLLGRYPASVYGLNALQSLLVTVIDENCPVLNLDDMESLIDQALDFLKIQAQPQNLSFLQRMRGMIAFSKGFYAQGYAYFRMAHEQTGEVDLLGELVKYQLELGQLQDAEETIKLMEQQNAARFGIEQYQVDLARQMLEKTRNGIELSGQQQESITEGL